MQFDLGTTCGTPGEKLEVTTVEFTEKSVVVQDAKGIYYRSYYDQHPQWQKSWNRYLGVIGAKFWGEVGISPTEKNYLRFFLRKFIALPQSQQAQLPIDPSNDTPRSPYDVVTAQLDETMSSISKAVNPPINKKALRTKHVNFDPGVSLLIGNFAVKNGLNFKQAATTLVEMGINFDKQ